MRGAYSNPIQINEGALRTGYNHIVDSVSELLSRGAKTEF